MTQVKLPQTALASHMEAPVGVWAAPFQTQHPADAPGKREDDASTWVPATHLRNRGGVPDSYLPPGPALTIAAI